VKIHSNSARRSALSPKRHCRLKDVSIKGHRPRPRTLTLASTSTEDLDEDGDVDVDFHRRPCTSTLVMRTNPSSRARRDVAQVEVNDRVNLYVAVKLKVLVKVLVEL